MFLKEEKNIKKTLMIVSEVEFIELYIDQPLFGDVSSFLKDQDFILHKFLDTEQGPLNL